MSVLRVSFNVSDLLFFEKRRVAIATRFIYGTFSKIRPSPNATFAAGEIKSQIDSV